MSTSILVRTALISVLFGSFAHAAEPAPASRPAPGSWGFDWQSPTATKCIPVTAKTWPKLATCEFKAEGGAFDLDYPYHICRPTKDKEFFVYATKARCLEAIETMEANAY